MRIIAGTVVRESVLPNRDVNILLNIINNGNSSLASMPLTGRGLCFCGVGFDIKDLALFKFMRKKERLQVLSDNEVGEET